ncbi:MAG: hypothetical protein ACLQRH_15100, partial [Acidimicrobiales bacterium]
IFFFIGGPLSGWFLDWSPETPTSRQGSGGGPPLHFNKLGDIVSKIVRAPPGGIEPPTNRLEVAGFTGWFVPTGFRVQIDLVLHNRSASDYLPTILL